MLNVTTLPPPPIITAELSQLSPSDFPTAGGEREPATGGQSVDKARSADSIKQFIREGQCYNANEDRAHVWHVCEYVCVCARVRVFEDILALHRNFKGLVEGEGLMLRSRLS